MNDNTNSLYSWPVIFFVTVIFWPIGILLILKRVSMDKKAAMACGKLISILGYGMFLFAVIGFICCIGDGLDTDILAAAIFFGVAGLTLIGTAQKIKGNAEDVKRYLAVVVNGGKRNLEEIASAVKKPYEKVRSDLQMMIDKEYLKGAYIDEGKGELVLQERQQPVVQIAAPLFAGMPMQQKEQPKKWVIQCHCCGANNMISGDVGACEYCGSPIGKR